MREIIREDTAMRFCDQLNEYIAALGCSAQELCAAANILKERGAQRVFACVSHGVLGDMARERIAGSCIERVLTSDTVPMAHGPKVDCISVGDLLGHAVRRIHDGESVSSLFDI